MAVAGVKMSPRLVRLLRELEQQGITDSKVLAAMATVPREAFVPSDLATEAYENHALPIGHGQTISQPYIVGLMTQELQLAGGEKVLEVGTGSGYQAAVLAAMGARVFTIERLASFSNRAQTILTDIGFDRIHFRVDDGSAGWPDEAPFEAIVVTAAAASMPPALAEQLAEGGRLVIPLGDDDHQTLWRFRRSGHDLERDYLCEVRFVPLISHRIT